MNEPAGRLDGCGSGCEASIVSAPAPGHPEASPQPRFETARRRNKLSSSEGCWSRPVMLGTEGASRFALYRGMLSLACAQAWTRGAKPSFEATLRLEKSVYVLGEEVRFWVGVRPTNARPVPDEVRNNPCRLFVTKPDRSTETLTVGPAPDQALGATGTEGGMGLDNIMAGTYTLVWECSNQKTTPVQLSVEKNEIFDQVKTQFRFERSGTIKMGTSIPVVMRVENNSAYTIRFPQRGAMGEEVSVGAIREEPSSYWMGFYPDSKLSHSTIAPLTYTWDVAAEIPSVVLQPGGHFEQKFLFEDAYQFDQAGNYRLMVSTVLQVLVGEKDGSFARICPIRFPASVVEQLVVTQ